MNFGSYPKISNRCVYDLRLSCTFVVDTSQAAQTLFVIYIFSTKLVDYYITRRRLRAFTRDVLV